ncbi:MAG: DUF4304 domain-containing protein [Lachnospiraceae bacterium]|nr:DUF4304 domain-containing protein [Lachnospiraceae bacterium]
MEETIAMDSKGFKKLCKDVLKKYGFKRRNDNTFYLTGDKNILCNVYLQYGIYGPYYYIECDFYLIDRHQNPVRSKENPEGHSDRMRIMSRGNNTYKGEHFMTDAIHYGEYSAEELTERLEDYLRTVAIPPVIEGIDYMKKKERERPGDGGVYYGLFQRQSFS